MRRLILPAAPREQFYAPGGSQTRPQWMGDRQPAAIAPAPRLRVPQKPRAVTRKRDQRCRPPTSNLVAPCGSPPPIPTVGPGATIPLAYARSPRSLNLHRPTSSSPLPPFCLLVAGQLPVDGSAEAPRAVGASLDHPGARASTTAARPDAQRAQQLDDSGRQARTTHRPPSPPPPLQVTSATPRPPSKRAPRRAGARAGWCSSSSLCASRRAAARLPLGCRQARARARALLGVARAAHPRARRASCSPNLACLHSRSVPGGGAARRIARRAW